MRGKGIGAGSECEVAFCAYTESNRCSQGTPLGPPNQRIITVVSNVGRFVIESLYLLGNILDDIVMLMSEFEDLSNCFQCGVRCSCCEAMCFSLNETRQ